MTQVFTSHSGFENTECFKQTTGFENTTVCG